MSDIIPGSLNDVNNQSTGFLDLNNYGPKSQIDPPLPYEVCTVCGFIYRRNYMVRYKKKWYCKPQECYQDIVGKELLINPEANFKNRSLGMRFWKGAGGQRT